MDGENSDRIITTAMIRELLEKKQRIYFLRSSLSGKVGHCADIIRSVCAKSTTRKEIKIILPSVINPDLFSRAEHVRLNKTEVLNRLIDWLEELVKLVDELSPMHSFELRTHMEPHRWHGVFTDDEGIAGLAWHASADMTYSSLNFGPQIGTSKWMFRFMSTDFDWLWNNSEPYAAGKARKQLERAIVATTRQIHPVLLPFKSRIVKVMQALHVIKTHYPDSDGCGITKLGMHEYLGMDESGANALLKEMQSAGLVEKLGPDRDEPGLKGRRVCGRVLTGFGQYVLREWELSNPGTPPER
jgi:hypothetical protein